MNVESVVWRQTPHVSSSDERWTSCIIRDASCVVRWTLNELLYGDRRLTYRPMSVESVVVWRQTPLVSPDERWISCIETPRVSSDDSWISFCMETDASRIVRWALNQLCMETDASCIVIIETPHVLSDERWISCIVWRQTPHVSSLLRHLMYCPMSVGSVVLRRLTYRHYWDTSCIVRWALDQLYWDASYIVQWTLNQLYTDASCIVQWTLNRLLYNRDVSASLAHFSCPHQEGRKEPCNCWSDFEFDLSMFFVSSSSSLACEMIDWWW